MRVHERGSGLAHDFSHLDVILMETLRRLFCSVLLSCVRPNSLHQGGVMSTGMVLMPIVVAWR